MSKHGIGCAVCALSSLSKRCIELCIPWWGFESGSESETWSGPEGPGQQQPWGHSMVSFHVSA